MSIPVTTDERVPRQTFFPGLLHDTIRVIGHLFKSERTLKQNKTAQKNKGVAI